jgi:hypothetical protein
VRWEFQSSAVRLTALRDGEGRGRLAEYQVADRPDLIRLGRMGSKYVPSIKDLKAGRRFQQKQNTQSKFIKPAPKPPAKKGKKP